MYNLWNIVCWDLMFNVVMFFFKFVTVLGAMHFNNCAAQCNNPLSPFFKKIEFSVLFGP